jgi:hypothetical protein
VAARRRWIVPVEADGNDGNAPQRSRTSREAGTSSFDFNRHEAPRHRYRVMRNASAELSGS